MAKILFVSSPYENLGIEYISAALKSAGHNVELVIDPCLFFNPYQKNIFLSKLFNYRQDILRKIESVRPDLICFSVMTDTYQWALDLARCLKAKMDIPIIFGGVHPTIVPDIVIQEKAVDYVCVGEGESAFLDLAGSLKNPGRIDNIWSKENGAAVKAPLRPLLSDLDSLPFPDKDLYYLQSKIYAKEYFIMAGRGCNYSCAFCCNQIFLQMYGKEFLRRRTVGNIIAELSIAKKKYNFEFVWFMDDNFPSDILWLKEFSREYRHYINLPFFCYAHPNYMNLEAASLLKEANCYEMALGVESLNERTRRFVNRDVDSAAVEKAIRAVKGQAIVCVAENIIGFPGEHRGDIIGLIDFYNIARPDLIVFSWLKIFPGTTLLKALENKNVVSPEAVRDILHGRDNSLALGGNYSDMKSFRSVLCLLVLIPFLPVTIVSFLRNTGLYRLFVLLNPNFLLRVVRIYKSSAIAGIITGKNTYDTGAKVSLRIYKYFMAGRFMAFKYRGKNG